MKEKRCSRSKKENLDGATPGEMPPPFVFTDAAAKKVKVLLKENRSPELGLCPGWRMFRFPIRITFDEVENEDDAKMERLGVPIDCSMSYQYLTGSEIDFKDDLEELSS